MHPVRRGEPVLSRAQTGDTEPVLAAQKHGDTDCHADTGGHEAPMPTDFLAERARDQRRKERAEVDAHIKDREPAVAARIMLTIEATEQRGDVRLVKSVTYYQKT